MSEAADHPHAALAVDPPARIVILGAGPIGIEAGLYARYLGYEVCVLERDTLAANVRRWSHLPLASPFALTSSSLGLAALAAQDPNYQRPPADEALTGGQWLERYVIPLANTDLLADRIQTEAEVIGIRQPARSPSTASDEDSPETQRFVVQVRDKAGREWEESAAILIDASGVFGNADGCGIAGQPAPGESACADRIEYEIPDVMGAERSRYELKRTLVVGDTIWATMTLMGLSRLIEHSAGTRASWFTAESMETSPTSSLDWAHVEAACGQRRLAQTANRLVCGSTPNMIYRPETEIQRLDYDYSAEQFLVTTNHAPHPERFDRMVVNAGFHRDLTFYGSLQPNANIPTDLTNVQDCQDPLADDPSAQQQTQDHFYLLGAKSFGRDSQFLFSFGLDQIRTLFAVIRGRQDLDLYATADPE